MRVMGVIAPRRWTAEEDEQIDQLALIVTPELIAEQLGRSVNSVKLRIYHRGLRTVNGAVFWTEAEDAALRSAPKGTSAKQLAAQIGRSLQAVYMRQEKLGVRLGTPSGSKRPWTKAEDDKLRELAWTMSWERLAVEIGRSMYALKGRVQDLHIRHSRFWTAEEDAVIMAGGSEATMPEMMQKLGRGYNSVWNRRRALGVEPGNRR